MIKGKIFRFLGQEGYFLGTETTIFSIANLSLSIFSLYFHTFIVW